jgi:hypothetical protein
MTEARKLFVLNPAVAALMWDPEPYQMVEFRNPHWLNSAWLGTAWNVILLPTRVWHEILKTLLVGDLLGGLVMTANLAVSMLRQVAMGLAGRLRGVRLPIETLLAARQMSEQEACDDIKSGPGVLLRPHP